MNARSVVQQTNWLVGVGLLVSAHRLAVGFVLSDGSSDGSALASGALIVLGGLSAVVLTGAQLILASVLATVRDRLLEWAWVTLVACAVTVMSASTLASMYGEDFATVLDPGWLAGHVPAVVLSVGLALAIEVALASVRRASMLLARATEVDLDLSEGEAAEMAVQLELARIREDSSPMADPPATTLDTDQPIERRCPWCNWTARYPRRLQAVNAVNAHRRYCSHRPAMQRAAGG